MAEQRSRSGSKGSPEDLAERFAKVAKRDPERMRRVQERWGAGDMEGARRIILEGIESK
jgi:hypothetical protein